MGHSRPDAADHAGRFLFASPVKADLSLGTTGRGRVEVGLGAGYLMSICFAAPINA